MLPEYLKLFGTFGVCVQLDRYRTLGRFGVLSWRVSRLEIVVRDQFHTFSAQDGAGRGQGKNP